MSDRVKRRLLDFAITTFAIFGVLILPDLWASVFTAAYGVWCYYDGLTARDLSGKPKAK